VRRRRLLGLLVAVACLGLLGWTVYRLGPRAVAAAALEAHAGWLALSVLPVLARFLFWTHKWNVMLRRERAVPYGLTLRVIGVGSFVNLTTPTAKVAGGIVRAALLHRLRDWRMSSAYGWALADQLTNVLANLLLTSALAVVVGLLAPGLEHRGWFVGPGIAGVGLVAAAAALRGSLWRWAQRPELARRLAAMVPARFRPASGNGVPAERMRRIFGPLLHEGSALGTFLPDVVRATPILGSLVVSNALVLRALGVETSPLLAAAATVVGYFVGVVIGVWGGVGVTEAALTGLYVQLGMPGEQAAAAALLHRAAFYAVVLAGGGACLLQVGRMKDARLRDGSLGDEQ
jgi:uncharacterized membrane protein YbhN (UPF0104 family)